MLLSFPRPVPREGNSDYSLGPIFRAFLGRDRCYRAKLLSCFYCDSQDLMHRSGGRLCNFGLFVVFFIRLLHVFLVHEHVGLVVDIVSD